MGTARWMERDEKRKKQRAMQQEGRIKTQGWEAIRCRGCMGFKASDREMEKERQRRKQNHTVHRAEKKETEPQGAGQRESEKLKILMGYDTEEGMKKQGAGAKQREMEKLKTARGNRAQRKENEKTRIWS